MSVLTPRINDIDTRIDKLDRNLIINGGMTFWQRTSSYTGSATTDFIAGTDRFKEMTPRVFTGTYTIEQDNADLPDSRTLHAAKLTWTPTDGTSYWRVQQRIESVIAAVAVGKKVSLSFDIKTNHLQDITLYLRYANAKDDFSGTTSFHTETISITPSTSWQRVTIEDMLTHANAANGIDIELHIENSNNTGSSNVDYITNIKLSRGSSAQEFSYAGRDYTEELQLCERYYERITGNSFAIPCRIIGSGTSSYGFYRYNIRKRAPALLSASADSTFRVIALGSESLVASIVQSASAEDFFEFRINSSVNFGTNVVTIFRPITSAAFIAFDAEL